MLLDAMADAAGITAAEDCLAAVRSIIESVDENAELRGRALERGEEIR